MNTYDGLLGDIELSRGVGRIISLTNAVNLVVGGCTMMVTALTSTGNRPLDVVRMPRTNTADLSETLVCLSRQLLGSPTGGNTLVTLTLGDGNDIDNLVLLEDGVDRDLLLEKIAGEVDLLLKGSTVDLDLHEVGLLLGHGGQARLRVDQEADDGAVLLDAGELVGDLLATVGVLGGVLGEGLLLGLVPVLVEAALDLIGKMLGPDGGERTETTGSLDVTNNTNGDNLRILSVSCSIFEFRDWCNIREESQ